jgi:hypothetical protein
VSGNPLHLRVFQAMGPLAGILHLSATVAEGWRHRMGGTEGAGGGIEGSEV